MGVGIDEQGKSGATVPWLAGLSGRLRLDVAGRPTRVLEVRNGKVSTTATTQADPADAVIACDSDETLAAFNRGQLNPVVGALQGRLGIEGDRALAIKIILALEAAVRPPPPSARAVGQTAKKEP
jgi:putative sterol carrier protein